jgi:hypothetical protein
LSVAPQNQREDEDGARHALKSSSLLRLKASPARVFQCGLKSGGGAAWMVHVTSSWKSCGDEAKDGRVVVIGCIGHYYPYFTVFNVLCSKDVLVFYSFDWTYKYDPRGWDPLSLLLFTFIFLD